MGLFLTGQRITADLLNQIPQGEVARYSRGGTGTATASAGTETGFMRIDNIPVRAGYTYSVFVPRTLMTFSATTAGSASARLRGSTSGNATIASTQLDGGEIRTNSYSGSVSFSPEVPLIGFFYSTVTGSLSVLVTFQRSDSALTITWFASSAADSPIIVNETGITTTAAGTDI